MKFEDEAKLILETVAKTATSKKNRERAMKLGGRVANEVKSVGFRIFSDLTDRISSVDTLPFDTSDKPSISKPVSSREYAAKHFSGGTQAVVRDSVQNAREAESDASDQPISSASTAAAKSDPLEEATVTDSQMPAKRYGINRAVLLIRRPDQAFAYWEIDEDRIPEYTHAGLELINLDTEKVVAEQKVPAAHGKHYFELNDPKPHYVVELYVEAIDEGRVRLSQSKPARYEEGNPTGSQRPLKQES